jgi:hypothetical protein
MSRAFDTIVRGRLMIILRDEVRLNEDEQQRMCEMLLADTTVRVTLKEAVSEPLRLQ